MKNLFARNLMPVVASVVALAMPCAIRGNDAADSDATVRYESPTAVFNVYREALRNRDSRKVFSLLTARVQNDLVFGSFSVCVERQGADVIRGQGGEAIGRLLGKYIDFPAAVDTYNNDYRKKHGIDPTKAAVSPENGPKSLPPRDEEVWRAAIISHVNDNQEFVAAVAKHFVESDEKQGDRKPIAPIGDLEGLVVRGDTATGKTATLGYHFESPPGKGPQKIEDKIYKTFRFKRVNGGWLFDSH